MTAATTVRTRPRRPEWAPPTRLSSAIFAAKVTAFQLRRAVIDLTGDVRRHAKAGAHAYPVTVAAAASALWSDEARAERGYQLGKVQNLRQAARALDGIVIPAGQVFSFWRHVGRASARRGFATGRMLQQGCMVPAAGGGLCQLSNALYDVALSAGCEIVERHAHSRIVPGSAAAWGRDATVAWNYVDLRFRAPTALRLEVRLDHDMLTVRLLGEAPAAAVTQREAGLQPAELVAARDCASCDETECFMHEHGDRAPPAPAGRRAFLVDEAWPELQAHVAAAGGEGDFVAAPLAAQRWGGQGRWAGASVDAPLASLGRSLAVRRTPSQGALRRAAELAATEQLALRLAKSLAYDVTEVTVAQSYLPFMWRAGVLGGRRFQVLMTRLPMGVLQARLDAAHAAHPERATLGDFRASPDLVEAEAEALSAAERIVTPHADIAALFGERAVKLDWRRPVASSAERLAASRRVAFAGPTVARKGAYEMREAARTLDLDVALVGANLEGPGFWDGLRAQPAGPDWLGGVAAVIQPALVEDQPRKLLAALAAGVPVIATPACGLEPQPGLTLVPPDDVAALSRAIAAVIG